MLKVRCVSTLRRAAAAVVYWVTCQVWPSHQQQQQILGPSTITIEKIFHVSRKYFTCREDISCTHLAKSNILSLAASRGFKIKAASYTIRPFPVSLLYSLPKKIMHRSKNIWHNRYCCDHRSRAVRWSCDDPGRVSVSSLQSRSYDQLSTGCWSTVSLDTGRGSQHIYYLSI